MRHALCLAAPAALAGAPAAFAAAPSCAVSEICEGGNDNCRPATGTLLMRVVAVDPVLKLAVQLNERAPIVAAAVQMPGRTSVITRDETGTEHQFNLYEDGKFYHLTSTPDESAHGGMAKVRYAGQCAEE